MTIEIAHIVEPRAGIVGGRLQQGGGLQPRAGVERQPSVVHRVAQQGCLDLHRPLELPAVDGGDQQVDACHLTLSLRLAEADSPVADVAGRQMAHGLLQLAGAQTASHTYGGEQDADALQARPAAAAEREEQEARSGPYPSLQRQQGGLQIGRGKEDADDQGQGDTQKRMGIHTDAKLGKISMR